MKASQRVLFEKFTFAQRAEESQSFKELMKELRNDELSAKILLGKPYVRKGKKAGGKYNEVEE